MHETWDLVRVSRRMFGGGSSMRFIFCWERGRVVVVGAGTG